MDRPRLRFSATLLLLLAARAWAADPFERIGFVGANVEGLLLGARQAGIGNADLCDPQSPASWLYNPATLSASPPVELAYDRLDDVAGSEIENLALTTRSGAFHTGFARSDADGEPIAFRTAFDPVGTDSWIRVRATQWLFGMGYDLSRHLPAERDLRLALGATFRRSVHQLDVHDAGAGSDSSEQFDTLSMDLGLSSGIRRQVGLHTLRLMGMVAWQSAMRWDDDELGAWTTAPEVLRYGLTAAFRVHLFERRPGQLPGAVDLRLAFAHRRLLEEGGDDSNQYGAEIVLLDLLALRGGRDERFGSGSYQAGIGVQTPRGLLGPLHLRVHRTWVEEAQAFEPTSWKLWGFELGAAY